MIYYLDIKLDDIMSRDIDVLTDNIDFFFVKEVDKSEFGDESMWMIEKDTGKVRNFDYMSYIVYYIDLVKETTKEKFIEHFRSLGLM